MILGPWLHREQPSAEWPPVRMTTRDGFSSICPFQLADSLSDISRITARGSHGAPGGGHCTHIRRPGPQRAEKGIGPICAKHPSGRRGQIGPGPFSASCGLESSPRLVYIQGNEKLRLLPRFSTRPEIAARKWGQAPSATRKDAEEAEPRRSQSPFSGSRTYSLRRKRICTSELLAHCFCCR